MTQHLTLIDEDAPTAKALTSLTSNLCYSDSHVGSRKKLRNRDRESDSATSYLPRAARSHSFNVLVSALSFGRLSSADSARSSPMVAVATSTSTLAHMQQRRTPNAIVEEEERKRTHQELTTDLP